VTLIRSRRETQSPRQPQQTNKTLWQICTISRICQTLLSIHSLPMLNRVDFLLCYLGLRSKTNLRKLVFTKSQLSRCLASILIYRQLLRHCRHATLTRCLDLVNPYPERRQQPQRKERRAVDANFPQQNQEEQVGAPTVPSAVFKGSNEFEDFRFHRSVRVSQRVTTFSFSN
jgi:hypothetical protein